MCFLKFRVCGKAYISASKKHDKTSTGIHYRDQQMKSCKKYRINQNMMSNTSWVQPSKNLWRYLSFHLLFGFLRSKVSLAAFFPAWIFTFCFPFYKLEAEIADTIAWFESTGISREIPNFSSLARNSQERLQLKAFVIFMVRLVMHSSVYLAKSDRCDCGVPGLALFVLSRDAQQELICLLLSVGWLCLHTAAGLKLAWTVGRTRRLCCDCSADTYCVSPPKRTEDKWGFAAICIKRFIHCKC